MKTQMMIAAAMTVISMTAFAQDNNSAPVPAPAAEQKVQQDKQELKAAKKEVHAKKRQLKKDKKAAKEATPSSGQ